MEMLMCFLLETSQDLLNVKAAFIGIQQAFEENRNHLATDDFRND